MKAKAILIFSLLVVALPVFTQNILDDYIKIALESNLALQQKSFSYQKSVSGLKAAKRMYFPELDVTGRFTVIQGGRVDKYDIGEEFINPIHKTLNDVTASLDDIPDTHFNENVDPIKVIFLRPTELEAKLRLTQPIFQPELLYSKQISQGMMSLKQAELETYKRELVAEVKKAYYQHLIALESLKTYKQAKKLLDKNLRISKSLVENEKATSNVIYRIEAEISDLEVQLTGAEKNVLLSASYFNFLLNRPFETEILVDSTFAKLDLSQVKLIEESNNALEKREELTQLKFSKYISMKNIKLSQSGYIPSLAAMLDYGFQGTTASFSQNNDFLIGSLAMRWNLSSFYKDRPKVQQSKLDLLSVEKKYDETQKRIRLQVNEAYYSLQEAEKRIKAAKDKLVSAKKNYEIVQKKFEQNLTSHIDLLDAQTVLTRSNIQAVIANYNYLIKLAEYEKVTASNTIYK